MPFSLWHSFILRGQRNPYVCGGPVTVEAMAQVLAVCSLSRAEYERQERRAMWMRRLRMRRLLAECYLRGLERAHVELATWLDEQTQYPEHWQRSGGSSGAGEVRAPAELHLLRILCRYWRMTFAQAWDVPCATARALADVSSEADGDDTLVSEREALAIEEARRA